MGNKQTAVEWLSNQLSINDRARYNGMIEQAEQMHKEQIINARVDGDENHTFNSQMREEYAEDYYKETYGKDETI